MMICNDLLNITGFRCQPINGQGTLAQIHTPFHFSDGEPLPVYVQSFDNDVHRFFDDGRTVLHFLGCGLIIDSAHKLRFLNSIAQRYGAIFNAKGVLEVISKNSAPSDAFAKYISCLVAVTQWELEHQGLDSDSAAFATLVAHALIERFPGETLVTKPTYLGSSGKRHEIDFKINGRGYLAVKPSSQSAAPAVYKLVDITNRQTNESEIIDVVVDDRFDAAAAKSTQQVFRHVADNVLLYSKIAPAELPSIH